jgi:hypothetical protein
MPVTFTVTGDFASTKAFLEHVRKLDILAMLDAYGAEGVAALESATPVRTGLAAGSWGYDVHANNGVYSIYWTNTDVESGFPVAIMLQYGHGTRGGGYVQGRDYINPAMRPIFDEIADKVWKAVTSA